MRNPISPARLIAFCLTLVSLLGAWPATPLWAQKGQENSAPLLNEPIVHVTQSNAEVSIIERFTKVLQFDNRIKRIDGFDPAIVSVTAITPTQIRVQALAAGITTMVTVDEHETVQEIQLFVTGDSRHLQAYLNQLFPQSSVTAVKVKDSVVLRGWVTEPAHLTEMVEIAEQFFPRVINQMRIGGVQQVLLRLKVMEVQRSKIRELGVNWLWLNHSGYLSVTPGSIVPVTETTLPFGGPPSVIADAASLAKMSIGVGLVDDNNIFQSFVTALKEEALLKILAEPELVATNGRPAHLLSGGEFPVLVPQSLGTVSIEWREFGVKLEAVPIVLGNGRLRLELEPEVSERDFTNAVEVNGLTVPGVTTRRVNTQVEMRFGQTLMLAGLISHRRTSETDKVPFFGELPIVGAAFRKVRDVNSETELVVLVTPELVAPMEADQVPSVGPGSVTVNPTDREFYLDGLLEVPNYGSTCMDCEGVEQSVILPGGVTPSYTPADVLPPAPAGANGDASTSGQQVPQFPTIEPKETQTGTVEHQRLITPTSAEQVNRNVRQSKTTRPAAGGTQRKKVSREEATISAPDPVSGNLELPQQPGLISPFD